MMVGQQCFTISRRWLPGDEGISADVLSSVRDNRFPSERFPQAGVAESCRASNREGPGCSLDECKIRLPPPRGGREERCGDRAVRSRPNWGGHARRHSSRTGWELVLGARAEHGWAGTSSEDRRRQSRWRRSGHEDNRGLRVDASGDRRRCCTPKIRRRTDCLLPGDEGHRKV